MNRNYKLSLVKKKMGISNIFFGRHDKCFFFFLVRHSKSQLTDNIFHKKEKYCIFNNVVKSQSKTTLSKTKRAYLLTSQINLNKKKKKMSLGLNCVKMVKNFLIFESDL